MRWFPRALAASLILTAVPLTAGSGSVGATPSPSTCGSAKALQLAIVHTIQPAGEPETFVCPTYMPSTAVIGTPYGEGATAWGGRAFLSASVGITWHGWQYNLYETYASTFVKEVAATVPPGFPAARLAAAWAPYNYVHAGADSDSWTYPTFWHSVDGLVVPESRGEPVPWTPCTEETSPYRCTRIW